MAIMKTERYRTLANLAKKKIKIKKKTKKKQMIKIKKKKGESARQKFRA